MTPATYARCLAALDALMSADRPADRPADLERQAADALAAAIQEHEASELRAALAGSGQGDLCTVCGAPLRPSSISPRTWLVCSESPTTCHATPRRSRP